MNESFDLQEYLSRGIETFVADVVKATLKNPKESAFMLKFAAAAAAANKKRRGGPWPSRRSQAHISKKCSANSHKLRICRTFLSQYVLLPGGASPSPTVMTGLCAYLAAALFASVLRQLIFFSFSSPAIGSFEPALFSPRRGSRTGRR